MQVKSIQKAADVTKVVIHFKLSVFKVQMGFWLFCCLFFYRFIKTKQQLDLFVFNLVNFLSKAVMILIFEYIEDFSLYIKIVFNN